MENADVQHRQVAEELKEILPDVRSLLLTLFVANTSNRRSDLMALQRARFVIEHKMDQVTLERLIKYKQNILKLVERMKRELYPLMGRRDRIAEARRQNVQTTLQRCQQPIYQRLPVRDVVRERFAAPGYPPQSSFFNHSAVNDFGMTWTPTENENIVRQPIDNYRPEWTPLPPLFQEPLYGTATERVPESTYPVGLEQSFRSLEEIVWGNDTERFALPGCPPQSSVYDHSTEDFTWSRWAANELQIMARPPIQNNSSEWSTVPPAFEQPVYNVVAEHNPQTTYSGVSEQSFRLGGETVWNNNSQRSSHYDTQITFDSVLENSLRPDQRIYNADIERLRCSEVEFLYNRDTNQHCHRAAQIMYHNSAPCPRTEEETVRDNTDQPSYPDMQTTCDDLETFPRSDKESVYDDTDRSSYHDVQMSSEQSTRSQRRCNYDDHRRGSSVSLRSNSSYSSDVQATFDILLPYFRSDRPYYHNVQTTHVDSARSSCSSDQLSRLNLQTTYNDSAPSTRSKENTVSNNINRPFDHEAQATYNDSARSPRSDAGTACDDTDQLSPVDLQTSYDSAPSPRSDEDTVFNDVEQRSYHNVQTTYDNSAPSPRSDEDTDFDDTDPPLHDGMQISSEQSSRSGQSEAKRYSHSQIQTNYDHDGGSSPVSSRRNSSDIDISQENLERTTENYENDVDGTRSAASQNSSDIDRTPNENPSPTSVPDLMSNNSVEEAVRNQNPSSSRAFPEMEQDCQSSSVDVVLESISFEDQYETVPFDEQDEEESFSFLKLPGPGWQLYRRKSIAVVNHDRADEEYRALENERIARRAMEQNASQDTSTEYTNSNRDTSDLQYIWVLRRKSSFLPNPLIYGMDTEKEDSSDEEETEPRRERKRRRLNEEGEFLNVPQQETD